MTPGMFQESDGSRSMRRVLAFFFALAAVGVLALGAWRPSIEVVYGGIALLVAVIILLFFTTWGDVASIAAAWKGRT